jgi:ABC-type multidrug transport system ATPase subunit
MHEQALIEVADLVKVYGGETRALDGITFTVEPVVFGFLGPRVFAQQDDANT